MSFYNMLFGVNQAAPVLLKTLNLTVDEIPRFRDCYIEGDNIVIYTRTGGGNRDAYEKQNNQLCKNKFYIKDIDDYEFDSTYAKFYFRFPEEYADDLKAFAEKNQMHSPSEKWQSLLNALNEAKHEKI